MRRQEILLTLLCAAILAWQLFLPGFIGMADNADFAKVIGPYCVGAVDGAASHFLYFQPNYVRSASNCYNPHVPTSEIALAGAALAVHDGVGRVASLDIRRFDIRWMSAVHALIFLGFYCAVLGVLRPLAGAARILLSLAALFIFGDVATVAYLNSFYSDAAAILGGLAAVVLAILLTRRSSPVNVAALALFGVAALLFVTSKGQHGMFGFVPAGLAAAIAWREQGVARRLLACSIAVTLLAGMIWVLASTPDWYSAQARFNLIFFKIAKYSNRPLQDLRELGLNEGDLRFVGMHSFMPDSPMNNDAWSASFRRRSTYGLVGRYYLHHPGRALGILWSDLRDETAERRPVNLSNYPQTAGMPAGARTNRMASWSAARSWLFRVWPEHILLWFAFVLAAAPSAARRFKSRFQRSVAWTVFAVALIAAAEFCFASLADACETYRHLLMFHILTDVTIFLTAVFVAANAQAGRPDSRSPSPGAPAPIEAGLPG